MTTLVYDDPISESAPDATLATETAAPQDKGTYAQILKSSALVGGSSVLNIVFGIVRTKAMALLLGPAGFGLFGLYNSVATLAQSVAGMGVNSSGVRQIAEAAGTGNTARIAQTSYVLHRVSLILGVLGAIGLVLFSRQVSSVTFGTGEHAGAVSILSLSVLFTLISGGQAAMIQGMRRIADLAAMSVLGALFGTVVSIVMVYFLREKGVVPALVAIALMTAVVSWWYGRRVEVSAVAMPLPEVVQEASALVKLGFAFMFSSLMTMGSAYIIRITVLHKVGFEATGLYQSAWTLGGLYVSFILQAMGADFYPRLTAVAADDSACNRLVNEQTRVGMLLAGPGVVATLTFAPLVIALFYSSKFGAAVGVLRWTCLGMILQVITWPMGFIIVAKAKQGLFIACELIWSIASVALAWVCISYRGLDGAGIAFFLSYVFHGVLIYAVVRRLSAFRWSAENRTTGLLLLSLITVVFCACLALPLLPATIIGTIAVAIATVYSLRVLVNLMSADQLPAGVRRILSALRLCEA
jgi:PST family polysaccharide transporter